MGSRITSRMMSSITVLAHSCSDISQPTLMILSTDGKRYLIGRVSEGFQRSMGELKVKSSRLQGIWLTGRLCWSSVSGLPGYLLSIGDSGAVLNRIYSGIPANIANMAATWRYINWHDRLNVEKTNSQVFTDDNLEIEPFLVLESTCYIIQMQPQRGKFLPQKAIELGVPKGKLFGRLSNGKSVILEDGTEILPDQVLEPANTPTRAIVFDLPTIKHLEKAIENNYQKRKRDSEVEFSLDVVYYFLGEEINPESDLMAELISKFPQKCLHYISHPKFCTDEPVFESLDALQEKLRAIVPGVFPVMRSSNPEQNLQNPADNVRILHRGDTFNLSKGGHYHHQGIPSEVEPLGLGEIVEPTITTLGTGASCPSKYRNVSATVVRVPTSTGVRSLVFDCGEGTVNGLKRLYSKQDLDRFMNEMDILYISHMHADHHLGSLEFIKTWQKYNSGVLNVMGPEALLKYLESWAQIDSEPMDLARMNFIDLENIVEGLGYGTRSQPKETVVEQLKLKDAKACRARHCDRSYSGVLSYTLADGQDFSVAYSGDTCPSSFFATMAKGATVLIHEATHDDSLAKEARDKKHSTVSDAAGVAREMQARYLVLTHFSQRYPKMHATHDVDFSSPTCFGFDGMNFGLSKVGHIQAAMPQIAKVFEELDHDSD